MYHLLGVVIHGSSEFRCCYISREICLFPGWREILGNTKFQIMEVNGLLVGPVVGMLICWKLIKLGSKTQYRSK